MKEYDEEVWTQDISLYGVVTDLDRGVVVKWVPMKDVDALEYRFHVSVMASM